MLPLRREAWKKVNGATKSRSHAEPNTIAAPIRESTVMAAVASKIASKENIILSKVHDFSQTKL